MCDVLIMNHFKKFAVVHIEKEHIQSWIEGEEAICIKKNDLPGYSIYLFRDKDTVARHLKDLRLIGFFYNETV